MDIKVKLKIIPYQQQEQNNSDKKLKNCHWETSIPKKFNPFKHTQNKLLSSTDELVQPKTLQELENEYHKQRGSLAKRPQKKIKTIIEPEVSWPLHPGIRVKNQIRERFTPGIPYTYKQ